MKEITNVGNLPRHLQAFAKELGGAFAGVAGTEFYEMNSVDEYEKKAMEVGYECIPTVDQSTGRGYLVGFEATEPKRIVTLQNYSQLKIYFVECTEQQVTEWTEKIQEHRELQQEDMFERRNRAERRRANKRKGDKND